MGVQRLTPKDFGLLENPGVKSVQIVWGQNAPEAKVTITRVTVQPSSTQVRHSHDHAEQIWLVERGTATLLLADDQTAHMHEGEVVRTPAGDIHGIINWQLRLHRRILVLHIGNQSEPSPFSWANCRVWFGSESTVLALPPERLLLGATRA
jgi:quercetin dioxygenase-like cupin family protein